MNDNAPNDTSPDSVQAERDRWKSEAQTAWQKIAELRHYLSKAVNGPWLAADLDAARKVLERAKA